MAHGSRFLGPFPTSEAAATMISSRGFGRFTGLNCEAGADCVERFTNSWRTTEAPRHQESIRLCGFFLLGLAFDLPDLPFEIVNLSSDVVQRLMIMSLDELVSLGHEPVNLLFQLALGVYDLLGEVNMRLLNSQYRGKLVHYLGFVLAMHPLDLRVLQGLLSQFDHGHFLEICPFHSFSLSAVVRKNHARLIGFILR